MNHDLALELMQHHYNHAKLLHPNPKSPAEWDSVLKARLMDLFTANACDQIVDSKLVAGKRALQIGGMMLRVIEDLELGLPGPEYDAGTLRHAE